MLTFAVHVADIYLLQPRTRQEAFRELRQSMHFSIEKMARALAVSFRTVHRFERDLAPSARWMLVLAEMARDHGRHDLMEFFYRELADHLQLQRSRGFVALNSAGGYYLGGIQSDMQARIASLAATLMQHADDPRTLAILLVMERAALDSFTD